MNVPVTDGYGVLLGSWAAAGLLLIAGHSLDALTIAVISVAVAEVVVHLDE